MTFGNFREEFPDFDPATLPAIPTNWTDTSWHNDGCPSWRTPAGVIVCVDYANEADREFPGGSRFAVIDDPEKTGHNDAEFQSDDWEAVLIHVDASAIDAERLNAWYERVVGYRPQADCPEMTDEELRSLCREYLLAANRKEA